ncbi:valine--tRNA ligase [Salinirussus salinus]|jgi:valyl-tRNA synthetase|uniref:valine--tRNA ligase n=1 Tax=Salinirussus salinus TaxID=1198300 RepID=UPI00135AC5F3|nr:valine--tRNA ligase [Salinirussus salinus]
MTDLPDSYEAETVEAKWREEWQEMDVYEYEDTGSPDYVVDTPPPYPTGNLHIGNALGWCYMDFAARYRRLQGYDVKFPQGWDCHGLPTEVKVEENNDLHRTDVPRDEFRQMCIDHTEEQIDAMKETMHTLGFSQDWSTEYKTMDPDYWGETQRSFVRMADSDYVYRDEHPVNWCPRCETAIADAEVETEEGVDGTLYYITFPAVDGGEDIEIATTRPELLAACVSMAVHPDDDRYADRVGETFEVPLFGQEVELIADEDADADFGTGAVMICTFGDKQDVDWWAEHDLDLRPVVTEDGHLGEAAGEYAGMGIDEAKEAVAADLEAEGYLNDTEPTEQNVGQCWRCDTPIEILSKEQWFVEVDRAEILEHAREVEWIPEHMYDRLEDWTEGMEWDWVISRQRVFATPIPAWFCGDCGHTYIAGEDELPVEPTDEAPAVDACPECGAGAAPEESRDGGGEAAGTHWHGETDVMDTWMDSSISALYVGGWPDADFSPVQLREQGHDIIRTWAFYTILRTAALEGEIPWEEALINGMVFGEDGNKMSKSRGNFVQPEEAVEEYSADAFRQAMALGGQPGSDIQFQWKEVKSASRFGTKVWNITRFAAGHLDDEREPLADPAYRDVDRWVLSRCADVAEAVQTHMDEYRFDAALQELRDFVWHDLADDYLELIKGRLYEGRPGERDAARQALFTALSASLRMLSPFAPFLTEEAWRALPGTEGSVHAGAWPDLEFDDDGAEVAGELIADVASTVRSWKSDQGMALNAELEKVEVYPDETPEAAVDTYDLSEAVNGPVHVREGEPTVELVPVEVEPDHATIGPEFRDQAGQVIAALEAMDPTEVRDQQRYEEEIEVDLGEEVAVVPGEAVTVREEHRAESGEEVTVLEGERATVLVYA